MKSSMLASVFITLIFLCVNKPVSAEDFSITFEWGDIPRCNSGNPNRVPNPIFTLANVPDGTVEISFRLTDWDAPSYNHGGGTVTYAGEEVIQPGAFKYNSPCPPGGVHRYEWIAKAKDENSDTIGKAKAMRKYPE
jgi:phosphatidylethanolamine-binding protein (PEBP) family uncharacterized protein